jgi:hypothetical protein
MVAAGMIVCVQNYERGKIGLCPQNFEKHKECHASSDSGQSEKNSDEDSGLVTKQHEGKTVKATVILAGWQTPWSRVLLENPTLPQISTNLSAFYAIRKLITVFTTASYVSLSRFKFIQFTHSLPSFVFSSTLILHSSLRLDHSGHLFPSCFSAKTFPIFLNPR